MTARGTLSSSNGTTRPQKTRSASAGGSAGCGAQPGTRRRPAGILPPSYVNVPTAVAYAPVPDALVVTMVRILGLCWTNRNRHTPALTLDQLARLLDRPRTTLHRHLDILERELGWLRRERQDRRFVLHPRPPFAVHPASGISPPATDADALEESERDDSHTCAPGTSVAVEPHDRGHNSSPGTSVAVEPPESGHSGAHGTSVAVEPPHNGRTCAPGTSVAVEPPDRGRNCAPDGSVSSENAVGCSFAPAKLPGEGCRPSHVAVEPPDRGQNASATDLPSPSPELLRALAEVGIENPARELIALDPAVKPDWIPAWQLWAQHPARASLTNLPGYIVKCIKGRSRPPEPYLRLVRLTPAEKAQLRASYWTGGDDLPPDLRAVRSLYFQHFEDPRRG